jgi:hypothetical protein
MKESWISKSLVFIVVFLFIGIAIAPSINLSVVKASNDNDLVEVTTQACGIKGFGNTTVKLTKEQYQNLEQYLVDFRERLNQTTTKEEAAPIFKEAVVELDKYGLLPKEMTIEQAQRLVIGEYQNQRFTKFLEKTYNKNQYSFNSNLLCLVAGESNITFVVHRFDYWLLYGSYVISLFLYGQYLKYPIFLLFGPLLFFFYVLTQSGYALQKIVNINPTAFMNVFSIGYFDGLTDEVYYGSGWLQSFGLLGAKSWNGSLLGNLPGLKIPYKIGYTLMYPAMWGFSGIKITLDEDLSQKSFFGAALAVSVDSQ